MFYSTKYHSPVGELVIVSDTSSIKGIWFNNQKHFMASIQDEIEPNQALPILTATTSWLDEYFAGNKPSIDSLHLDPDGTEFRQKIWHILSTIPYGKTLTYKQIAEMISTRSMSTQAIGGAVGNNPISIIIPCHRVVGTNGNLTGYAAGLDTKISLLKHERVDFNNLFDPR